LFSSPRGDLRARGEPKLGQNAFDVTFSGALGDDEGFCDLPIAHAFRDEVGDLLFPAGQGSRPGYGAPRCGLRLLIEGVSDRVLEFAAAAKGSLERLVAEGRSALPLGLIVIGDEV
jgi:hypothetical protein